MSEEGPPPRPEKSFILTIEATKIGVEPPLEIEKWLGSPPLEPLRALPWKNSCLHPWEGQRHMTNNAGCVPTRTLLLGVYPCANYSENVAALLKLKFALGAMFSG